MEKADFIFISKKKKRKGMECLNSALETTQINLLAARSSPAWKILPFRSGILCRWRWGSAHPRALGGRE